MSETTAKSTGNKLVDRILAILGLDDAGQIAKFINKTIKILKRDVVSYERNIVNIKHNHEGEETDLQEKIEDLKDILATSHTAITIEDIKDNETANKFRNTYLQRIRTAETNLEAKEKELKELNEALKESIKEENDKIALRKKRIKTLEGK